MSKTNRILSLATCLLIALLLSVALVNAQDTDGDGRGGRLVVADAASDTSLDPFVTSWHSWPHYALYATLFKRDANLDYVGFLVDTWEASEDGTELSITLIENATFTDGTPVDAEAIKWNLEKYADPENTASQGADLRGLLGGAVITENIFGLPGVGRLAIDAINNRDYPMIQGTVLLVATTFVLVNLIVDVLYVYVDPRIRCD
jgi:ABC-type transport system substrate-binding protein